MNLELENKTALVTGSTAGIGLAIAANLAREGATVIINGRTKKRMNDAIKLILSQYSNAKLEPLIVVGPTLTEGVNKFLVNLAKKANVSQAEIEANFFKNERPGSLLQRFARAEEVSNLVLYYSSPLSSATNGAAIRADGGVVRSIL